MYHRTSNTLRVIVRGSLTNQPDRTAQGRAGEGYKMSGALSMDGVEINTKIKDQKASTTARAKERCSCRCSVVTLHETSHDSYNCTKL